LDQKKDKIKKLKERIKDIYDEKTHDDIYLLRYCLSNTKTKDSEKCIRYSIDYRQKNSSWLDEASKGESSAPMYNTIIKYTCASIHKCRSENGAPVVIVRANLANPKVLLDTVSEEKMIQFLVFQKEICYIKCDELTRKNRKITKILTINDINGVSLFSTDKRFFKALGDSSKIADNLFPQLLEKNIMMNPPTIFKIVMSIATVFMSKKSLSKMTLCKGNTESQNISKCPFATKSINEEDIPSFLGGKCVCEKGCVGGVDNKHKKWSDREINNNNTNK